MKKTSLQKFVSSCLTVLICVSVALPSQAASAMNCQSVLKTNVQLPVTRQSTAVVPVEGIEHVVSPILKDMLFDNSIFTNEIFFSALYRVLENRGFWYNGKAEEKDDELARIRIKKFELVTFYNISKIRNALNKIAAENLFLIARETFLLVKSVLDASALTPEEEHAHMQASFKNLNSNVIVQTRYYLNKYQAQEDQIILELAKLYKNQYFNIIEYKYKLQKIREGSDIQMRNAEGTSVAAGLIFSIASIGLGVYTGVQLESFLTFLGMGAGGVLTSVLSAMKLYSWRKSNLFENTQTALDQQILKALVGQGLIEGTLVDIKGVEAEVHPAIESDGVVSEVTDTSYIELLMKTFRHMPTMIPTVSPQPSVAEFLQFGDYLDQNTMIASRLLLETWEDFIELTEGFPTRLAEFNTLIRELMEAKEKDSEKITRLRDLAEDFTQTKKHVIQRIDRLDHLLTFTGKLAKGYDDHKTVLEAFQGSEDAAKLSRAQSSTLKSRIEAFRLSFLTTQTTELNYDNLIQEAITINDAMNGSAITLTGIETMIATGFNAGVANPLLGQIEQLSEVFKGISVNLKNGLSKLNDPVPASETSQE